MPDNLDHADHVRPFVHEGLTSKALHFSICEIQSRMKLDDPTALDLEYTRTMMGFLLFQPDPRQIAMIGLGGGSMAKFCHRYLPGTRIQVVEINPHVIALRDEFHVPADDHRFRVIHGDGAQFVRYRSTRCDALLVDGFDSSGQPARLCTQRFYDDCREMLQPGGMLVVNLHYGHRHYDTLVERIGRSFDGAILVVDDGDSSNSIVFACKGHALDAVPGSVARRPAGLDRAGAGQLQAAFALVGRALKDRQA
ncbi:fused MFS/spermidine synthase [Aquincola sp. S2]|uniref:Fused MFS/spermidine synthase n=1 Tax=Pseudaquabacterium terrae TaxID=2732868 RepID=A0ABX2EQQ1_9BURK|nr:fused MFS/spermidine synthase [Aquabacterium terrae]NRF71000.1 fused MFS/spermidine synthase [Aquabacterium terrae]